MKTKMKICIISEAYSSHTQRFSQKIAKMGHDVHLFSNTNVKIPGVILHHVSMYDKNLIQQYKNIREIKKIFTDLQPDIYHLFGMFSVLSLGTMILVNQLKPLVVSVWGSDIESNGVKLNFIKRQILNQANVIISLSGYLAKKTVAFVRKPELIKIIHWGIDLDEFYPKKSCDCVKNEIVIGFAKKLYPLSAPDILLKAFAVAQKTCKKKVVLHLAGEGEMENKLKKLAVDLGIADSVIWLGMLEGSTSMLNFYHSIDFLAMPSRKESLGMSAIEASACGVPVIATKIGGLPEIIEDKTTGLLIENEDIEGLAKAIAELAEDDNKRITMGREAVLRIREKFNNEILMDKLLELYQIVQS